VAGVRVGQTTVVEGEGCAPGSPPSSPTEGDLFRDRVPAAIHVGNGFGKLVGITQVRELGELETPILLTCTLCVWQAADAMVAWLLEQPGMENVRSINPVVGETNDGGLNDIRSRPVRPEHVVAALEGAAPGPVEEGSVGAGTGTRAFGWKGGWAPRPGSSPHPWAGGRWGSWCSPTSGGSSPSPERRWARSWAATPSGATWTRTPPTGTDQDDGDGSIMIVVATDAPLSDRNLERLASGP
jgi:D-aminopeptidase